MAFAALVILLIGIGAFFARKIPAISIPAGVLFVVPFVLGIAEQHFRSRDNSVGAIFVPLILFVLGVLALFGAFLFIFGMSRLTPKQRMPVMLGLVISTTSIGSVVLYQWSQGNIDHVIRNAEEIAGGEPYCIDVPSGDSYKEALSPSDFSGYRMRAPHGQGSYYGPHAILAIGAGNQPVLYHWSYSDESFVKDTGLLRPVYCQPRSHFAVLIPKAVADDRRVDQQMARFRFAGMYFSVPARYRINAYAGNTPSITFYATAPNFTRVPEPGSADAIFSHIEVNFADSNRTDVWLTRNGGSYTVEESGEEFGLTKQTKWYVRSGRPDRSGPPAFQYFTVSDDRRIAAVIDCPDKVKGHCLHAFRSGGWTYTFNHSPANLEDWKIMQERLVSLTRSFIQASTP